jgi:hypothetical protein
MSRWRRQRYTMIRCEYCHTSYPDYNSHRHTRAEEIAYTLANIERSLKYANADNPSEDDRTLVRQYAELLTEWWRLPASAIGWQAALVSPSRKRRLTAKGNIR